MGTNRKLQNVEKSKTKGGSKLKRSEVVSIRLDRKLKFVADMAARKQRRTISSFIEWAVEEAVKNVKLNSEDNETITAFDLLERVWDVDEADRFVKLALNHPELLNHEEEVLWKLIRNNPGLWEGYYLEDKRKWKLNKNNMIFERLRQHWETFKQIASGELSEDSLPQWSEEQYIDSDDNPMEIPF